jgi:hypothetical protein
LTPSRGLWHDQQHNHDQAADKDISVPGCGLHHFVSPFAMAQKSLCEHGLCAILWNPKRVLNVIHAVPSLPKSEFCGTASFRE